MKNYWVLQLFYIRKNLHAMGDILGEMLEH